MEHYIVDLDEELYLVVTCPNCGSDFTEIENQTEDGLEYYCRDCEHVFEDYEVTDFADEEDWKVLDEEMRIAILGE